MNSTFWELKSHLRNQEQEVSLPSIWEQIWEDTSVSSWLSFLLRSEQRNHESETVIDDLMYKEFKIELPEATELTLFSVDFSIDALNFLFFFFWFGVGKRNWRFQFWNMWRRRKMRLIIAKQSDFFEIIKVACAPCTI